MIELYTKLRYNKIIDKNVINNHMQIDFKLAVPVLTLRHRSISISDLFIPIFTRGHTVAIFCTTSGSFCTHIYEQKGVSSVPNRCTWYLTQRCATIRIT